MKTKLPGVGTTIFTTMSKMAGEFDAINLSQGYPDFSVPQPLLDLMSKYLNQGYNQYPPMTGVPYLREQIAKKIKRLYNAEVDIESEITITSGATEALFVALQVIVHPGDEVIVFDPAYDAYEPAVNLAQGKTIHLSLGPGFRIDWNQVADAITPKTRAIVLNSPHNPTGSTISKEDLQTLAELLQKTDLYLVSDEVYEHMVFDAEPHHSLLTHEALRQRTFVISSFGKTYHATGWKVGYCIAPQALTHEFRKIHQFVTFTTHTPTQWALAEYMENYSEHYLQLPAFYQSKRDLFLEFLSQSAFECVPSAGTYFQLADYSQLSATNDIEFVTHLTQQVGVAAIPVSVFYDSPPEARLVRFCFAKDDDTLHRACEKLAAMERL
ncbi:MAG: methionine aminotransferase [bacterium]|nr:aminotransferase class I/II-fold pyridoxal phosphate-dependent enzyme [Gammaproteobacteria bacterium]